MSAIGFRIWVNPKEQRDVTFSELRQLAEGGLLPPPLAKAFIEYMERPHYSDQNNHKHFYSVTQLSACPRRVYLEKHFDYYETADTLMNFWFGTAVHDEIERALKEQAEVDPDILMVEGLTGEDIWKSDKKRPLREAFNVLGEEVILSGTPDLVYKNGDDIFLYDWKTTNKYARTMLEKGEDDLFSGYADQLNIYAYMMRNQFLITKAADVNLTKYGGFAAIGVKLESREQTYNMIIARLETLVQQENTGNLVDVHYCRANKGGTTWKGVNDGRWGNKICEGFGDFPCPFWYSHCEKRHQYEIQIKKGNIK